MTPRPQAVTAASVLLIVVGANVALGGAALSVVLFRAGPDACLCLACPFAVMVLLAGLGCLRVGWLVLNRPFLPGGSVAAVASLAAGVGGVVAFVAGAFLVNEVPHFARERPPSRKGAILLGAVALAFCDGMALVVAGFLLAAVKRRLPDADESGTPPLPARVPPP